MAAEHQIDDEDQKPGDGGDVEPAEVRDDSRLQAGEQHRSRLRKHGAEHGEEQDQSGRDVEDGWVDLNSRAFLQWGGFLQNGIGQDIFLLALGTLSRTRRTAVGCMCQRRG